MNCKHCRGGWFPHGDFGQDVECVNGILIDIDEAYDGASDVCRPVAPCHPHWRDQQAGRDFPDDSVERLKQWRNTLPEDDFDDA